VKVIVGDLVQLSKAGYFDVIVHGCNCQGVMGAGIARQIAHAFPEARVADTLYEVSAEEKLGTISTAWTVTDAGTALLVVNAYTQLHFGRGIQQVSYDAVSASFEEIAYLCHVVIPRVESEAAMLCDLHTPDHRMRIGYPRIGAGLGGGDWRVIEDIIDKKLAGLDHTLVVLKGDTTCA